MRKKSVKDLLKEKVATKKAAETKNPARSPAKTKSAKDKLKELIAAKKASPKTIVVAKAACPKKKSAK